VFTVSLLAAALIVIMLHTMNFLGNTELQETMRPMAKTAALAVRGNLQMLSDRIFLIRENELFVSREPSIEEKVSFLYRAQAGMDFKWLGFFSLEGQLAAGTRGCPPNLDAHFVYRMQSSGNLVINDTLPGLEPEIVIGIPVLFGGGMFNYLVGSYRHDMLADILGSIDISPDSTAYIINDYGRFMAHQDMRRVILGESIFTDYLPGSDLDEILGMMLRGHIDSVQTGSGVGRVIFSFAPIQGTTWTMVIEAPWKDFFAPIQRAIMLSGFIILVLLGLFTLTANVLISKLITEPLKHITDNANSIDRGIFKSQLPENLIQRQDEIGQLARAFVSMHRSIEKVIGDIEQITKTAGEGKLDERVDVSSMGDNFVEGNFLKMVSGMNSALDVICSHLDAIPVALALFNDKRDILYRNCAMDDFLLMHDLETCEKGLLERIAGSGSFAPGYSLDSRAAAIFDPGVTNPPPFVGDIAILGHDGGSNFTMTLQRVETGNRTKNSVCVMLLLNDVTLLTRAKIDAELASHAKSEFLSRMSHEIRTPMNAVIGMTEIAKRTDDIEKVRSCLEQVESSSTHLLGVINDILDFSKMESGKFLLDNTEFSLAANLEFVVSMMLPKARQRNINIRLSAANICNDGLFADSLRLNQVLINLLSNAIKFSPDGSDIFLNVRELGSENGISTYIFEVVDKGIGISEFQASKLFMPFEQADGSTTRNYGGTGLGLIISKNLVEMMGGKITLDSEEGKGSTFTFTIRCESQPKMGEKIDDRAVPSDDGNYDFSGKRCLIVDDIEINREIIMELLSSTNLALEPATNGQEAVEKFAYRGQGYFDIIFMDMQMPVMDGCTATEEIRRIEKKWAANNNGGKSIPIVAMTANILQADIDRAAAAGMNAHLGKPIELETTLKTLYEQINGTGLYSTGKG
jgi:signal transduction histidine kinase/CheY-like chemotaxis protein/HAMP domain-containing protein